MIKKIDFNESKINLKTKIMIGIFILLSIIYLLDKFFDTYTFVSPVKKLEFQWVIQKRNYKKTHNFLTNSVNLSIIHSKFTCYFKRHEKLPQITNGKTTIFFKTSSYERMEKQYEREKRIISYRYF